MASFDPSHPVTPAPEGYELWSPRYDAFNNPMVAMADRSLELEPPMVAGQHVLELGCGTARNARLLLAQGAAMYTGVDASGGMLAQSAFRGDARVRLVRSDLLAALPLPEAHFQFVLFSLVLEHLEDAGPALRQAARHLAPGGVLRILELHAGRQRAGSSAHFYLEGERIQLPSYPHEAKTLSAALAGLGCGVTRVSERAPDAMTVARVPQMVRYGSAPLLLDLEAAKTEEARNGGFRAS